MKSETQATNKKYDYNLDDMIFWVRQIERERPNLDKETVIKNFHTREIEHFFIT